jgi:nicotinamidase-related amidase
MGSLTAAVRTTLRGEGGHAWWRISERRENSGYRVTNGFRRDSSMPLVERDRSALLVIDTQPGFVEQPKRGEQDQSTAAATLERIAWLAGIAMLLDVPVVVVEEGIERAGSTVPRVLERLPERTPVVSKTTFTVTASPHAMEAIRATGADTLVLVGFETDVCVAQSAVGLRDLGFRVVVIEDATFSTHDVQHQRGLARMFQAGVERNHCKGLFFEWTHTVERAIETVGIAKSKFGEPPVSL